MKKIIITIAVSLAVISIYQMFKDNKIYYVNIGDNLLEYESYADYIVEKLGDNLQEYNNAFTNIKYQTIDLINAFDDDLKIDNKTIKNVLIKADLVTLSIGNNDLNRKDLTKEYIDEYINDIDILLSLIRKWCKEKIILIGLNNAYANSLLKQEAKKYDLIYIDIYSYASFYKIDDKLNILGHKYISEKIIDKL